LKDELGNRLGYGWSFERKAGSFVYNKNGQNTLRHPIIEGAPDNVWFGYMERDPSHMDLITGDKTPLSGERCIELSKLYNDRSLAKQELGSEWLVEYDEKNGSKSYYPLPRKITTETWEPIPLTLKEWETAKAKGPAFVEKW